MKRDKGLFGKLFDFKPTRAKPVTVKPNQKVILNKGAWLANVKIGNSWYGLFNPKKVPISMTTKIRKPAKNLGKFYTPFEKGFYKTDRVWTPQERIASMKKATKELKMMKRSRK
jgi:hypothetical protein